MELVVNVFNAESRNILLFATVSMIYYHILIICGSDMLMLNVDVVDMVVVLRRLISTVLSW